MAEPTTTAADDLELLRSSAVTAGIIASGYFRTRREDLDQGARLAGQRGRHRARQVPARRAADGAAGLRLAQRGERRQSRRGSSASGCSWSIRSTARAASSRARTAGASRSRWSRTASPIAGVVYAPARDEMYEASIGGGARLNGKPILRRRPPGRHAPLIPAPGAVHQELQEAGLDYTRGPHYPSLAYRLVQVATGKLDAAVARRGSHDWDIAGGGGDPRGGRDRVRGRLHGCAALQQGGCAPRSACGARRAFAKTGAA